jgi:hypothetical protein
MDNLLNIFIATVLLWTLYFMGIITSQFHLLYYLIFRVSHGIADKYHVMSSMKILNKS